MDQRGVFHKPLFCEVVGFRRIHGFLRDSRQSVVHGKAMMQTSGRPSSLFEMQMEQYSNQSVYDLASSKIIDPDKRMGFA